MAPRQVDVLAAVRRAIARRVTIPARAFTPPPTAEDPRPDPVVTPARDVIAVDPAELPAEIVNADGRVSLTQQVAVLWGAVQALTAKVEQLERNR